MEKTDIDQGVFDFEARLYNAEIGRFFSVDPKAQQFSFMSPYCYAANSPIKFIDNNGENYEVKVNPTDKTIIVTANITVLNQSTYDAASRAANYWNQQTTTYEGFTVTFQINVIPPTEPSLAELSAKNPKAKFVNKEGERNEYNINIVAGQVNYDKTEKREVMTVDGVTFQPPVQSKSDPLMNYYFGTFAKGSKDETNAPVNSQGMVSYVGGYCFNNYYVFMNYKDGKAIDDQNSVAHEFGHLLGLSDLGKGAYYSRGGIMDYGKLTITDQDLKNVVRFAIDQYKSGESNTVTVTGETKETPFKQEESKSDGQ